MLSENTCFRLEDSLSLTCSFFELMSVTINFSPGSSGSNLSIDSRDLPEEEEEEMLLIFDSEIKDSSKSSGAASILRTSLGWSSFFLMAEMLVKVGEQISAWVGSLPRGVLASKAGLTGELCCCFSSFRIFSGATGIDFPSRIVFLASSSSF